MNYEEAKKMVAKPGFILEDPVIITQCLDIIRDHEGEASLGEAANTLTENYDHSMDILFDLANWLGQLGLESVARQLVDDAVKPLIMQNYDKKVTLEYSIKYSNQNYTKWLDDMIDSPYWRKTVYELAKDPANEECPLLKFALTMIGMREEVVGELISVPMAWQTLEVLLKCIERIVEPLVVVETSQEQRDESLKSLIEMACFSEHTYLIVMSVLHCLGQEPKGYIAKHLARQVEEAADKRGRDVSKYSVHGCSARDYPEAMAAMTSILSKKELTQADISVLFNAYKEDMAPPVELLRLPVFIELLAQALFVSPPGGGHLGEDDREKYTYLYAYSASVVEEMKGEKRISCDRNKLPTTKEMVDTASRICSKWYHMGSGLSYRAFSEMPRLLKAIESRPVSFGVFRFIREVFRTKRSDFELNLETVNPYCIVFDNLVTNNPHMHPKLLQLMADLLVGSVEGLEDLHQLEYKKILVDRLVHLLICGYAEPTVACVQRLCAEEKVDLSLVRYFVIEILDVILPPYAPVFMSCMLPLVDNEKIMAGLARGRETDHCRRFIDYCKENLKKDS